MEISASASKIKLFFMLFLRCLGILAIIFVCISFTQVLSYKWVDPPFSNLMLIRKYEASRKRNHAFKVEYRFVPYKKISKNLKKAVVLAEDEDFFSHHGVLLNNLKLAMQSYQSKSQSKPYVYGYSTITQQTAKNLFLFPKKSLLRKGLEIYYSLLMELLWGKKRILEVYLNIIELGDGVFGVGAASHHFYKKTPGLISKKQACIMSACLTNPRKHHIEAPSPLVLAKAKRLYTFMQNEYTDSKLSPFLLKP